MNYSLIYVNHGGSGQKFKKFIFVCWKIYLFTVIQTVQNHCASEKKLKSEHASKLTADILNIRLIETCFGAYHFS